MRLNPFLLALGCTLFAATNGSSTTNATDKPNIVVIVADDLGRADVGFMGGKEIATPNLDKLAASGAILDAFYVQPVCSPTRAALLTGRYPTHTGVYHVVRPNAKWGLPLEERTLAQALQAAGYQTAICGKWHLGEFQPEYTPTRRGFHRQYGHYFGALDYFTKLRDGQHDWYRDDRKLQEEGYTTHLIAREACQIIRDKPKDKPLFLYIPFNAVHAPMQVPDTYLAPYGKMAGNRQKYAGMLAAMDEAIGKVLAALDEAGLRKDTLIMFSSDNGGPAPGQTTDNGPLRAGKGTIYEGGVRVCACASWPEKIKAGSVVKQPIHIVDCFPTLVKLAGGAMEQKESKLPLDGRDVWPVITEGAKSPHEAILICAQPNKAAVRAGDWKLLLNADMPGADDGPPKTGKAAEVGKKKAGKKKLAKAAGSVAAVQLYNLADDIGEQHDLAAEQPEKVKELRKQLDALLKDAVPPGNPS